MYSEILSENSMFRALLYRQTQKVQPVITLSEHIPFYIYTINKTSHLIRDFERFHALLSQKAKPKLIQIPEKTPLVTVLKLILEQESLQTAVEKIVFITESLKLGLPRKEAEIELLKQLGFETHPIVLKKCIDSQKLPESVLEFCHNKHFSLKQCYHLTTYATELLTTLLKLPIHMTASTYLDIAETLQDYLRKNKTDIATWLQSDEVKIILHSPKTATEKTLEFRHYLHTLRYPTLVATNTFLETTTAPFQKNGIKIQWDKTLENKTLSLTFNINSIKDLESHLAYLNSEATKKTLNTIWKTAL